MGMMELQLGLGLPRTSRTMVDPNCWEFDLMEGNWGQIFKKQRFDDEEAMDECGAENDEIQTLPLLPWDKNPLHTNDEDEENEDSNSTISNRDETGSGVGCWPPINSWRTPAAKEEENGGRGRRGSPFVKVKMEGVGIARKIDLNAHSSYISLTSSLITLFGRGEEDVEAYALTYQDKEGDWLLAGDVPWGYVKPRPTLYGDWNIYPVGAKAKTG